METTRLSEKAAKVAQKKAGELKNVPSMLRDRSSDLLQMAGQLRDRPMPVVVAKPRRPFWRTAGLWFAGGIAAAMAVGYLFDPQRGAARRQMAVDRAMAAGRDVQRWSGGKARHLRNRAMGTVAEMKAASDDLEPNRAPQRELG